MMRSLIVTLTFIFTRGHAQTTTNTSTFMNTTPLFTQSFAKETTSALSDTTTTGVLAETRLQIDIANLTLSCSPTSSGPDCTYGSVFGTSGTYTLFTAKLGNEVPTPAIHEDSDNIDGNMNEIRFNDTANMTIGGQSNIILCVNVTIVVNEHGSRTMKYVGNFEMVIDRNSNDTNGLNDPNVLVMLQIPPNTRGNVTLTKDEVLPTYVNLFLQFKTTMRCVDWDRAGLDCLAICSPIQDAQHCRVCDAITGAPTCCNYNYGGAADCPIAMPKNVCDVNDNDNYKSLIIWVILLAVLCFLLLILLIITICLLMMRRSREKTTEEPGANKKKKDEPMMKKQTGALPLPSPAPNERSVDFSGNSTVNTSSSKVHPLPTEGQVRYRDRVNVDSKPTTMPIYYTQPMPTILPRRYHESSPAVSVEQSFDDEARPEVDRSRPADVRRSVDNLTPYKEMEEMHVRPRGDPPNYHQDHQRKPISYV